MKRLITIISFLILSFVAFGQNEVDGTIKFMGIPVDGSKEEMISKLKEKGFSYNSVFDEISGEFNGRNVTLYIRTHHGLVDRICVVFPSAEKRQIIREYNNLLSQFQANEKYMELLPNSKIPTTENISYEMSINNKTYSSSFSYISPDLFTKEAAAKMRQKMSAIGKMQPDELQQVTQAMADSLENNGSPMDVKQALSSVQKMLSILTGHVWFTIHEDGSRFQLVLYYDNLKNQAHGEDL